MIKPLFPILVLAIIMTSCVSSKKFKTLEQEHALLRKELSQSKKKAKTATQIALEEKETATATIQTLEENKDALESEVNILRKDKADLETRINTLVYTQANQSSTMAAELKKLNEALTQKEQELMAKENAVTNAQAQLEKAQSTLAEKEASNLQLESSLRDREKRVNELETAIQEQENKSKALKDKLSNALLGFNESELTVEQRNGKVYVSLSQDLLFASGSANINVNGKKALAKLAEVMIKNPDIDITIEGHTDNIPFRGRGDMKDNWDLSVLRSTAIVRELIKNGVAPTQILASGRGEYFPISDNSTKEGRAKNRRSDIILAPKLDELMEIIGN